MKNEFDYVYAIVRVDEYHGPDCPLDQKVTVKKIVHDEDMARREVERLNGLQKGGVIYFSQVTRLEKVGPAVSVASGIDEQSGRDLKEVVGPEEHAEGPAHLARI